MLLENPKGDNRLDVLKLKSIITSIFGVRNSELAVLHGAVGMWKGSAVLGHAVAPQPCLLPHPSRPGPQQPNWDGDSSTCRPALVPAALRRWTLPSCPLPAVP